MTRTYEVYIQSAKPVLKMRQRVLMEQVMM